MLFIKAANALTHHDAVVPMPRRSTMVDYEAELAVVIGRDARNVSKDAALDFVLGYTCANDITAREWQRDRSLSGGQFCRAKSFDGFCPLGPAIVTPDEVGDPNELPIRLRLNGETMQDSHTSDMIFDVATLISELSTTMTLLAGTVLLTGTPEGVGFARKPPVWLNPGDVVEVEIGRLGVLRNTIGEMVG